jgi:GDP-mannose pyrophosphatase NudK
MTSDIPRIVARRPVFKGWNSFEIVTVEAADRDGEVRRIEREVIDHGDASVVLAIDRKRNVAIMVRQWRAPLLAKGADPYLLEVCAGIIDPGETPEETARREAEEEIGLKIGALRKMGVVAPSAGTLTERMHLFIAEVSAGGLTQETRGIAHEGEHIEVVEVPLPGLFDMARRGEIEDAKTLILVQRLMIEELDAV